MNKDTPVETDKDNKAKLKALREERKELIAKNRELLKRQNRETGLIQKGLQAGEKTIPELVEETRLKSDLILYYLSTMKKYGQVAETGRSEGYFKYSLIDASDSKE